MTFLQLTQSSWIYSEASQNWFPPSEKISLIHHRLFRSLLSKRRPITMVKGIEEVACVYHTLDTPLPEEYFPDGVFSTVIIVEYPDGRNYYIFTDVDKLY